MKIRISIIALGALCFFFSGCGCSKDKKAAESGVPSRMEDAVYTNKLVQLRGSQTAVAAKAAMLRARLESLGADAAGTPEYIELTNRLAQCAVENERLRETTVNVIRTRILKESAEKGILKK